MRYLDRNNILSGEVGTRFGHRSRSIAMVYPSPYHVGMSSLGFQSLYRQINDEPGAWTAERAFLPEDETPGLHTLESGRAVSEHDAIGVSIAYELEIFGLIKVLTLAGLAPLARDRRERDPPVILGGPLTFSNPLPAAPFADAVLLGECEELLPQALAVFAANDKQTALEILSGWPHVLVPAIHGEILPQVAACGNTLLPARSCILTPNTELSDMFLIEAERGCHRNCTFCVMRRSTNGGMRLVTVERILELIPEGVRKVGLVGAAVSDHPRIVELLRALVDDRGLRVGISSLRADRLNDEFVRLLAKGGYRTLTVASDAPSQRLRDTLEKKIKEKHLLAAAALAHAHKLSLLKSYMMIGVPGECDEDIDELIRFTRELAAVHPVSIGLAPFVPKYNTPLAEAEFAGAALVEARLARLRAGLKGAADVRSTSVKEAEVEAMLATSGFAAAELAVASQKDGFGWKHFYRYCRKHGAPPRRTQHFIDPYPPRKALLTHATPVTL
jgi:radical SAM superfamily enzyme YgiQ (UPF0313 family)